MNRIHIFSEKDVFVRTKGDDSQMVQLIFQRTTIGKFSMNTHILFLGKGEGREAEKHRVSA